MTYVQTTLLIRILVTICFAVSVVSLVAAEIAEHNKRVKWEQAQENTRAEHGGVFAVDAGPDHRLQYRWYIMLLSALALALTVTEHSLVGSVLPYFMVIPIVYDWIWRTARDLSDAPYYMADSPYVFRLASIYDWVSFVLIAITLLIQTPVTIHRLFMLFRNRLNLD